MADTHTTACYVHYRTGEYVCAYWCKTGGLMPHLERCIRELERLGGKPGEPVAREARAALERWSR